ANPNTASVTSTTAESTLANNSFSLNHNVTGPQLDLGVTKNEPDASFDPVLYGAELVYLIRVSNFGPSRATNVVVTDIPAPPVGYTMNFVGFSVNPVAADPGLTLYAPPMANCATVG